MSIPTAQSAPMANHELRERLRAAGILNGHTHEADPWEDVALPLSMIRFDHRYQRNVQQSLVKRIVDNFSPLLLDPPLVNWREDGSFYACDGQHRILACLEKFGDEAQSTCRLFYGLTLQAEASLFSGQDFRRPLTPLERFRGGLVAEREPYVSINAITEAAGWTVALYDGDHSSGGIKAVGALEYLHNNLRAGHLYQTLVFLRDAFGTENAPTSTILRGTAQFLNWYGEDFDREMALKRLRAVGLSGLRMEADKRRLLDRVTGGESVGMAILALYNEKRKPEYRLEAWETKLLKRTKAGKYSA